MSHFECPNCGTELAVSTAAKRSHTYSQLEGVAELIRAYLEERTDPTGQTLPADLFADARAWAKSRGVELPGDPKLSAAFVEAGVVRRRSNGRRLFNVSIR